MTGSELLLAVSAVINKEIVHQLDAQGHLFLEEIIDSINNGTEVKDNKNGTVLSQFAVAYLMKMEEGTPPSEISQQSHIQALTIFYQKLGFTGNAAVSKATALTKIHLREGSPSRFSFIHSSTGLRKFFIREAFRNTDPIVDNRMATGMDRIFIDEFYKQKSETI